MTIDEHIANADNLALAKFYLGKVVEDTRVVPNRRTKLATRKAERSLTKVLDEFTKALTNEYQANILEENYVEAKVMENLDLYRYSPEVHRQLHERLEGKR